MIEHRKPENLSDFVALSITKFLRLFADTFFAKRLAFRFVGIKFMILQQIYDVQTKM